MPKRTSRNADHVQRHNTPSPNNEEIANQLEALLTPAITAQQAYYRQLGLRARILNLPLMVAAVLTLLWRQVAGVQELTRLLAREDRLWCRATKVSQQALSERFLTFTAVLFEQVFKDLLPKLRVRWQQRLSRPLPESINEALKHFERIWVADGETSAAGGFPSVGNWRTRRVQQKTALFCKLKSLEDVPKGQKAGKICTVIDLITRAAL